MFKTIAFLSAVLCFLSCAVQAQYAGRYTDGKDYAVYFEETKYGLTIRPVIWTATQLLRQTSKDKFEVVDRASRGADFVRDTGGQIIGVSIRGMDGQGLTLRRLTGPPLPLELLIAGQVREAVDGYLARTDTAAAIRDAEQILLRLPTKRHIVVEFLKLLGPRFHTDAKFHTLLGYAYVNAGDRAAALKSFQRAYELDPKNERAASGLARLKGLKPESNDAGWKVPFTLEAVFAKPTAGEISAVEKDWATRDLEPKGIKEELRSTIAIAGHDFDVRIISHLVLGSRHYGAVLTPKNSGGAKLPIIIEAKGVSPTYFPLEIERLAAPRMMGRLAERFVYVVPAFRGEILNFGGNSYVSEGDRTDALDGATDDTIALLNAALETTKQADPKRICAFGHSRGGTVVMLAGIRDKRIACVVNWAGPTDWFYAMGTNGWTEQELWEEGLRLRANPQQTGGQNIERFLMRAINGNATLSDVRHRMIASSPLYFARRLPPSQHHYGMEDPFVPVRNGSDLGLQLFGRSFRVIPATGSTRHDRDARYEMFFYPDEGHDTDRLMAPVHTREFIRRILKLR